MAIDILNFEFTTKWVRDIGIVEPTLSYLELKHGLTIEREWIMDNFPEIIKKHNPAMIVIANGVGTGEHVELIKYAKMKGLKVATFISEGDMVDVKENVEILFWGNNTEKKFWADVNFQWSEKNMQLVRKYVDPESQINLVLSGGTGFDRYQFLPLKTKDEFLKHYGLQNKYKKVVGIGGFPFYFFLSEMYKKDGEWTNMHLDLAACEIMAGQKEPLRQLYKQVIKNNPDILFVLKYHPVELYKDLSEFYELDQFENTISFVSEEKIDDIINVSDLWMAFESTTCLESWLLGKTSIIANPDNKEFVRSKVSDGSPKFGDYESLNSVIQEFFNTGKIEKFDALADKRKEVINYVIGYGDGKNHIRAGEYIYKLLKSEPIVNPIPDEKYIKAIEQKYRSKANRKKYRSLLYKTPAVLIPKIKFLADWERKRNQEFDKKVREEQHQTYKKALSSFYNQNGI